MRGIHCRAHDLPRENRVSHQRAAVAVSGDLWRGAAHVEVDAAQQIAKIALHDGYRFGERLRLAAEELDGIGRIPRPRQIQRAGLLAHKQQAFCADHLARDEVSPPFAAQEAKCPVRKPGHRSQQHDRPPGGKDMLDHGASVGLGVGVAAGIAETLGSGVPRLEVSGFSSISVSSEMNQRAFALINLIL